jgi:hypothetical protein
MALLTLFPPQRVTPVSTGPTVPVDSPLASVISTLTVRPQELLLGADADGIGSSVGTVSNFGGGIAEATNILGTAVAFGSGAGTGDANAGGTTQFDLVNGMFTGLGTSQGGFLDQASGFFGAPGALTFPGVP